MTIKKISMPCLQLQHVEMQRKGTFALYTASFVNISAGIETEVMTAHWFSFSMNKKACLTADMNDSIWMKRHRHSMPANALLTPPSEASCFCVICTLC